LFTEKGGHESEADDYFKETQWKTERRS
jgi:hypothetical protein